MMYTRSSFSVSGKVKFLREYQVCIFAFSVFCIICGHNFIHCHHIINDSDTATEYDLDAHHQSFELKLYANHQLKEDLFSWC